MGAFDRCWPHVLAARPRSQLHACPSSSTRAIRTELTDSVAKSCVVGDCDAGGSPALQVSRWQKPVNRSAPSPWRRLQASGGQVHQLADLRQPAVASNTDGGGKATRERRAKRRPEESKSRKSQPRNGPPRQAAAAQASHAMDSSKPHGTLTKTPRRGNVRMAIGHELVDLLAGYSPPSDNLIARHRGHLRSSLRIRTQPGTGRAGVKGQQRMRSKCRHVQTLRRGGKTSANVVQAARCKVSQGCCVMTLGLRRVPDFHGYRKQGQQ